MRNATGSFDRRRFLGLTVTVGAGLAIPAGFAAEALAGDGAGDAITVPAIHPTTEWGARPPKSPIQVLAKPPTKLFIHHTATDNSTNLSLAHAIATAQSIQNAHQGQGWIDSGQHFTLAVGGQAMEGRHRSLETLLTGDRMVSSAHCPGQNDIAIGIETEGNFMLVAPSAQQYEALVKLSAYICTQFGIRAYQIYGHRQFYNTLCPGDLLYAMLPTLRKKVAERIGGDPTPPSWPVVQQPKPEQQEQRPDRVRAMQFLLSSQGYPVGADGVFGPDTFAAVTAYQKLKISETDGIAGPRTWGQLAYEVRRGAKGDAVKAVQSLLVAKGAQVGLDGDFGPGTEAGVKTFQTRSNLPSDGLVDPRTLSRLVA